MSWKDVLEQVNSYRGAIFQSFTMKMDAERFIAATTKEKNKNTATKRSDHKETFGKDTENVVSNEDKPANEFITRDEYSAAEELQQTVSTNESEIKNLWSY